MLKKLSKSSAEAFNRPEKELSNIIKLLELYRKEILTNSKILRR